MKTILIALLVIAIAFSTIAAATAPRPPSCTPGNPKAPSCAPDVY